MLAISMSCDLESMTIDFVQAYVQADVKTKGQIETPHGLDAWEGACMLKLQSNFYGLRDTGLTWFKDFKNGVDSQVLVQSKTD